jgi:hypothetical protein
VEDAMSDKTFEQELIETIRRLSERERQDVLRYARSKGGGLAGIPGTVLVDRIKSLDWPKADIEEMEQAIEDCERIDLDEWE